MLKLAPATYQRLLALLDEGLDKSATERDTWLATLRDADALLVPHLQRLLAERTTDGDTSQIEAGAGAFITAEPSDETYVPGQRIGRHVLVRELGRGGMGVVWMAVRDGDESLPRIALKLPAVRALPRGAVERLQREGAILAALNHPGIARLIETGVDAAGAPYLAMEYVDGLPLSDYCNRGQLDTHARLRLFTRVLEAVAFAHAMLVLHRDLKPGNVLVTQSGEVKLLDFGIAKLIDEGGQAGSTALTQLAGRAMTPDYASPEQIAGAPLTVASDVYALGVMLFELLTGERPYRLKRGSAAELEEAILTADPSRPSTAVNEKYAAKSGGSVRRIRRALSGELDTIILKCLRKKPLDRYESVRALRDDIDRFLEGRPVLAQPDSFSYRARKFLSRNWLPVSAISAVVVSLAAGLAAALWQAEEAREQSLLAKAETARANAALEQARVAEQAARDQALRADQQSGIATVEKERAEKRFDDVRALSRSLIFELHDAVEFVPGAIEAKKKIVAKAIEFLDKLAADPRRDDGLTRELATGYERVAQTLNGALFANQGDAAGANRYFEKALFLMQPLVASSAAAEADVVATARMSMMHGVSLLEQGRLKEAEVHTRRGWTLRKRLLGLKPDDPDRNRDMASADGYLANLMYEKGDLAAALAHNEACLARLQAMKAKDSRNVRNRWGVATAWANTASILLSMGDLAESRRRLEHALTLLRELEPDRPNHYSVLTAFGWYHQLLGEIALRQENLPLAREHMEAARKYRDGLIAKDATDAEAAMNAAKTLGTLGDVLVRQGDTTAGAGLLNESVAMTQKLLAARPNARRTRAVDIQVRALRAESMRLAGNRDVACETIRIARESLDSLVRDHGDLYSVKQLALPACPGAA